MKVKLVIIFISVVLILLMFGVEIAQGGNFGYPAPIDNGYPLDHGYPLDYGYPIKIGYPVYTPVPVIGYPVQPEPVSNIVQMEPVEPQYRNGRNLWQEIVYQFSKLLEMIK